MERFTGILGLVTMVGLAYLFSTNRKAIRMKTVAWGLGLQVVFAFLVLKFEFGRTVFARAGDGVKWLLNFSYEGSKFVFGPLGEKVSPVAVHDFAAEKVAGGVPSFLPPEHIFFFAFGVLPTIIFIAAFFAILYHIGVMQFIIKWAARAMTALMGASGAESLNVAASIFMGQTEAPLTIRPYLPRVTRSELMTIMTSGMAHVSGGIMGAYIAFGVEPKHILTAVIMTAPGTLLIAKMLVPETEQPETAGRVELHRSEEEKKENFLGAIARGTSDGLGLAINVGAMLIAFIALIYLTNGILGGLHNFLAAYGVMFFPESLQQIFGYVFAPVAWVIGVPWKDCLQIGNLLGTRMALNELVAFSQLGPMKATLSDRSFTIATFALCGFANFSSIGIQIGGIGALAPNKRDELAKLGIRAMLAGTMANLMSASIVGILM
ncbi:MAG: NupC/NupG family nucleoside CNT transporter [Acidobacteria bacterium]|nr:NupC/NupG family nucleoside CNT transporter [Acidobacteriota bacterium]MBI3662544.1 NupC/NupG family nucleoside CNT transporter [Acidobacteriota bacterium]